MDDAGRISTTHDWSITVDHAHLAAIRSAADAHAPSGALHLLHEVLAYVADEAEATGDAAGRCELTLFADRSVAVRDHGRGTDTRPDDAGGVVRKPVLATRDLRFFGHAGVETLPDGHPRRGMSVVAALSDWLLHENRTPAGCWRQRYERGVPVTDLQELAPDGTTGTLVRFRPDVALAPVPADGLTTSLAQAWPGLAVEFLDDRDVLTGPTDETLRVYKERADLYVAASAGVVSPDVAALLDALVTRLPAGARLLEVGTGPGLEAAYLEERGVAVDRTDATPAFVQRLREQGHAARLLDVRDADLGGPYDAVLANAVLLHLQRGDLAAALASCRSATSPGGLLALTLKEGDGDGWRDAKLGVPRWFLYWREGPLRDLLEEAGWRVLELRTVQGRTERWLHVLCDHQATV